MGYYNTTNLYASRVYAENPLALWALDDDFSFVSEVSASSQNVENWNIFNGSASAAVSIDNVEQIPFPDEEIGGFAKNSGSNYITYLMPNVGINTLDLDSSKSTICINANVWKNTNLINKYKIGFQYNSGSTILDVSEFVPESTETGWQKILHTFSYPASATIYPYLEIDFEEGGSGNEYSVYVNSLSVGQWSEKFHTDSTGIFPQLISSSAAFYQILPETDSSITLKYISADAYGITTDNDGYYILENNKMLGVNNGLPMVFGASNITNLYAPQTQGMPSIVIPGKGFLNQTGKYKKITAEFWLRIYNGSQTLKRIFGPLSSRDGLYVNEEFLTLRVGKYEKSYFVGKWYRPMLVDIVYTPENVSLLINGISVINLDVSVEELVLPSIKFDWLGFFAHQDVQPFELDCVAIYPYDVSDQLAKRRFVYAQGVEYPDIVSSKFGGDAAFIDYSFSKYSSEFLFPDRARWGSGFYSNLEADLFDLTFINYAPPEIQFFGKEISSVDLDQYQNSWGSGLDENNWSLWTLEKTWEELLFGSSLDFFIDNYRIQDDQYTFITMSPNTIFEQEGIYPNIFFNSIDVLNTPVNSIFGVFGNSASVSGSSEIIFKIRDRLTSNYFEVYKNSSSVIYNFNNGSDNILSVKNVLPNERFVAGINIDQVSKRYKRIIENFFSVPQNLSLSLGGYQDNIFKGKIYSFGFNNSFFADKDLKPYTDSLGFFKGNISASSSVIENDDYILKYISNYSLIPNETARAISLDVGSSGYWEGMVPLSVLGKSIVKSNGNIFYDLDMIQFNIDFPSPVIISQPQPHDQNDTRLKSYITLQDYRRAGSIPYSNWISASNITTNRLIDFDNTIDVLQSKYEVVDGTVIIPPKELVDFKDYYLGIHLEMSTRSISSMPIKVQRMGLSSLAFDESTFYPIGTKTGKDIYPFSRYQNTYVPKEKNPILIYKGSTPYLYLTDDSGITVLDYSSNATARGITMPINQNKSSDFSLGGIQMWIFYKESTTFDEIKTIGLINTPNEKIQIVLYPEDNGKRAKMKLIDLNSGLEFAAVKFYQNGNLVTNPYIEPMQWSSIVMSLGAKIKIESQSGQLELYHGVLFNNVAFFEKLTDVFSLIKDFNDWISIISQTWDDQIVSELTWFDVSGERIIQEFSLNGIELFNSYFGLSKIVVSDPNKISLVTEQVDKFMNISWSQFVGRPV